MPRNGSNHIANTKTHRYLLGADFAYYPLMLEVAWPLNKEFRLIIGGRSGLGQSFHERDIHAYLDWQQYERLENCQGLLSPTRHLDPEAELLFGQAKREFLRALDRAFIDPPGSRYAEQYFFTLIAVFQDYLAGFDGPLAVFFAHTPHFPWHLVFYHVCRHAGVPVFVFRRTQVPDAMFLDRGPYCVTEDWYVPSRSIPVDSVVSEAWSQSARLAAANATNRRSEREASKPLGIGGRARIVRRYFRQRQYYRHHHYYRLPWLRLVQLALRRDRQRRKDFAFITDNAATELPQEPFIYFALHYQPERTTVPEAGYYHEQSRAILAIAAAMPAHWQLVVKEHPRQLGDRKPDIRRLHYGRRTLYAQILALPNAILLNPFTDARTVIERSALTASCNGSSVFQGLQLGIPGFTFVHTWHSSCDSAPAVADHAGIAPLIERLSAKSARTVKQDYLDFLEHNRNYWFVGANTDDTVERSKRTRQALIASTRRELCHCARQATDATYSPSTAQATAHRPAHGL